MHNKTSCSWRNYQCENPMSIGGWSMEPYLHLNSKNCLFNLLLMLTDSRLNANEKYCRYSAVPRIKLLKSESLKSVLQIVKARTWLKCLHMFTLIAFQVSKY
jgi:hypothetical protein